MKFIPSFVHGLLDYFFGIALATSPWLLGLHHNSSATTLAVVLGVGTLLYSLLTNYEFGVIRVIPFRIHLFIDWVAGIFLLTAPWFFGFADRYAEPFYGFAMYAIAAALLTNPQVLGLDRLVKAR